MSSDEDLSKKVAEYSQVAKENPNVDIGMLMMNALQTQRQNTVSPKAKRWAYLISISLPPLGFLVALKYFSFSDETDAKDVAWTCIILTVVAVIIFWVSMKLFFSSAGVTPQQIEQIKPSDAVQLLQ